MKNANELRYQFHSHVLTETDDPGTLLLPFTV